jgi:hypothetical protein
MGRLFYLVAALLRCVSVVWFYSEFINHRDTEDTGCTEKSRTQMISYDIPPRS